MSRAYVVKANTKKQAIHCAAKKHGRDWRGVTVERVNQRRKGGGPVPIRWRVAFT